MAFESIIPIDLATSGASYTITEVEMNSGVQRYRAFGTRVGFQLTTSGTMYANNTVKVAWTATPTGVVDILGTTMPSNIQAKDCIIEAVYNGSSWDVFFDVGADQTGFIVDADISATAAIARTKLASGTADHVLINDGSGVMSSEALLSNTRGGTGKDTSADTGLAKVAAGTWSVATLVNADVNAAAAIAYSKLATLNTGQILAGNAGIPTAVTMSGDATISATGVVTIPDLMFEVGAGVNSLLDKRATTSSGNNGLAIGDNASNTIAESQAIGVSSDNSGSLGQAVGWTAINTGSAGQAIGSVASNTGGSGQAIGAAASNTAASGQAIGAAAVNRIAKSTNIAGAQIVRKSDGTADVDAYLYMSGAEVIIMSPVVDLETLATTTVTLPTGVQFFCNEVGVIATTISALVTQPTISWGDTGDHAKFVAAAITTTLTATGARQRRTTILDASGVTSLTAEVTVVGAATTLFGRYYWTGYLVENQ